MPEAAPATKETLYAEGHELYRTGRVDSAAVILARALELDSAYVPALMDMAMLQYEHAGIAAADSPVRLRAQKDARNYFARAERAGVTDAAMYDRLCELSVALEDSVGFLRYAQEGVRRYPYDRQVFNLGLAYYDNSQFQSAIQTMKDAIARFPESNYIGGYYRVLGRSYIRVDRDQTAERTLYAGLKAVDGRLGSFTQSDEEASAREARARLMEERVAMLVSLRRLHKIYKATDKLKEVERQLRQAGYDLE